MPHNAIGSSAQIYNHRKAYAPSNTEVTVSAKSHNNKEIINRESFPTVNMFLNKKGCKSQYNKTTQLICKLRAGNT